MDLKYLHGEQRWRWPHERTLDVFFGVIVTVNALARSTGQTFKSLNLSASITEQRSTLSKSLDAVDFI